jgi:hypothetical protein
MDHDVRSVIVSGEFGLLGGAAIGLATLPFTGSLRNVFIGSSVGLWLGIAVGFYYISNRNNPDNPLRAETSRNFRIEERDALLEPPPSAQKILPPLEFKAAVLTF